MFKFQRLFSQVVFGAVFFAGLATAAESPAVNDGLVIAEKKPAESDSLVIALRGTPRSGEPQKTLQLCRQFLPSASPDESARKVALADLAAGGSKTTGALIELLDANRIADENSRLAALAGIDALKPVNGDLSKRLAFTAIGDPIEAVRLRSIALIKARNDEWAMDTMVKTYLSTFGEGGVVKDPNTQAAQAAAGAALNLLGDKRVYNAMLYYATLEVRTQVSELAGFATRQIDSYTVNNGANATVVTPLSFPIQFPELKITSIKTTVTAPCAALSALSGMDFGNDLDAWAKWIRKQK